MVIAMLQIRFATVKDTIIHFVCPSKTLHKHCFQFPLGLTWLQEKTKTMLMETLGRQTKSIYGIFESGLFITTPGERDGYLKVKNLTFRNLLLFIQRVH